MFVPQFWPVHPGLQLHWYPPGCKTDMVSVSRFDRTKHCFSLTHVILASSSLSAGAALALVDVLQAELSLVSRQTVAGDGARLGQVPAGSSVLTGIVGQTVVSGSLALVPGVTLGTDTGTQVGVARDGTGSTVLTGKPGAVLDRRAGR